MNYNPMSITSQRDEHYLVGLIMIEWYRCTKENKKKTTDQTYFDGRNAGQVVRSIRVSRKRSKLEHYVVVFCVFN